MFCLSSDLEKHQVKKKGDEKWEFAKTLGGKQLLLIQTNQHFGSSCISDVPALFVM